MYDDRTTDGDEAANNEPSLTETNSRTIIGEEELAHDTTDVESNVEAYGARGGSTPSTDE